MKKTWRNIIIVSLILVVIEVVGIVLFLHPYYNKQKVFDSIHAGNWMETQKNFDKLNLSGKEDVRSYLDDYGAWVVNSYNQQKMDFQKAVSVFDAINSIDANGAVYEKYMPDLIKNELILSLEKYHNAMVSYDSNAMFEAEKNISVIGQRMSNDEREQIMIMVLNSKYRSFLSEGITAESMKSFASGIQQMSYYAAYEYSFVVSDNVDYVVAYRNKYSEAKTLLEVEDYFGVMDICKEVQVDPQDEKYKEMFETLYTDSYELGKTYYMDVLDSYVNKDDKTGAVNLMTKLEEYYGTDLDTSGVKEDMAEDWQKAYIEICEDIEGSLKRDLPSTEDGQYILANKFDEYMPDSVLLYDIDGNDVPEMILFDSSKVENDYVGSYLYGFVGDEYVYLGFVNIINLCADGNLVAFPVAFDRETGEEYCLIAFDGTSLSTTEYCQYINDVYYVNGSEVKDADYLSARSAILAHGYTKITPNLGYESLVDSISYILTY